MIKVAKIKCLGGHRLRATFSDGMAGEFDFAGIVAKGGPMAEPLRDPAPGWLRREIEEAGTLSRDAAA
jgi:hypothetical protein